VAYRAALERLCRACPYRGFESRPLRWVPPLGVLWTAKRGPPSLRYSRKGRLTAERQAVLRSDMNGTVVLQGATKWHSR
jgi:hypothetical protein